MASQLSWRDLIPALKTGTDHDRLEAYHAIRDLPASWSIEEGTELLGALATDDWPEPIADWQDPKDALLQLFWLRPQAEWLESMVALYADGNDRVRSATLVYLCIVGGEKCADQLVQLIVAHGWPSRIYPRLFRELHALRPYAKRLFPALFLASDAPEPELGNILLAALRNHELEPQDLEQFAQYVCDRIGSLSKTAIGFQRDEGMRWRFEEDYWDVRSSLGFWLDAAGYFEENQNVVEALRDGCDVFLDPWLLTFCATSLLRLGEEVSDAILRLAASDYETVAILYEALESLSLVDMFPTAIYRWEVFGAADMANWLKHPSELGRIPEQIELMDRFASPETPGETLYVWRFQSDDGKWLASVSGPYPTSDDPRPHIGSATFSRFEAWDLRLDPDEESWEKLELLAEAFDYEIGERREVCAVRFQKLNVVLDGLARLDELNAPEMIVEKQRLVADDLVDHLDHATDSISHLQRVLETLEGWEHWEQGQFKS